MKHLEDLIRHIVTRVNINLRKPLMDVEPYVTDIIPLDSLAQFYSFYALSSDKPNYFSFYHSALAGTYFLGKCQVTRSVLYKSDLRGDELKQTGTIVEADGIKVRLHEDEKFHVRDSFLVKTLVHNNSRDPKNLETFKILNTVSLHYANIHGTPVDGCFLEPFSTVDLSICHDCAVGAFSYVQAGELSHKRIEKGRVWVRAEGVFEFNYQYPAKVLDKYISIEKGSMPKGVFMDFFNERKEDFNPIYASVVPEPLIDAPATASVSPYAVIKGKCEVGENVLVAQRAYLENASMGDGGNAQENCYIVNSIYEGMNVTAHGGKVINCHLGQKTFVGFNSFLRGLEDSKVKIGKGCIVMPHTIIDATEPIEIPDGSLVWGFIEKSSDLENQTLALDKLEKIKDIRLGQMEFVGNGAEFVKGFRHRIEHILEENGAYFDGGEETRGHAQKNQMVSYSILQPYQEGKLKGLCPSLVIRPFMPKEL